MDDLITGFMIKYIPVDLAEEEELVTKGMLVAADASIGQKPSMILLIPTMGLVIFSLYDTLPKKVVGKYGGTLSSKIKVDCAEGLQKANMHALPTTDEEQINGCPGWQLPLRVMAEAGMVGSLFASSRVNPSSDTRDGNAGVNRFKKKGSLQVETAGQVVQRIWYITMNSTAQVMRGQQYKFSYDWARACGRDAYTAEEIQQGILYYQVRDPPYVMDLVNAHRASLRGKEGCVDDPLR